MPKDTAPSRLLQNRELIELFESKGKDQEKYDQSLAKKEKEAKAESEGTPKDWLGEEKRPKTRRYNISEFPWDEEEKPEVQVEVPTQVEQGPELHRVRTYVGKE
jgi:hypothetical protein